MLTARIGAITIERPPVILSLSVLSVLFGLASGLILLTALSREPFPARYAFPAAASGGEQKGDHTRYHNRESQQSHNQSLNIHDASIPLIGPICKPGNFRLNSDR